MPAEALGELPRLRLVGRVDVDPGQAAGVELSETRPSEASQHGVAAGAGA